MRYPGQDLSQNSLTTIHDAVTQFPHLVALYLQGNAIARLKDVEKLAALPSLRRLALHSNPCVELHYRERVAIALPDLVRLDFACITADDRLLAKVWHDTVSGACRPKKRDTVRLYGAG